jgi:hypothetical protein
LIIPSEYLSASSLSRLSKAVSAKEANTNIYRATTTVKLPRKKGDKPVPKKTKEKRKKSNLKNKGVVFRLHKKRRKQNWLNKKIANPIQH